MRLTGRLARLTAAAAIPVLFGISGAFGQDAVEPANPAAAQPAPWGARCTSAGREAKADCQMEQRVVISNTGQLLAAITIRVPIDSEAPVMMIQTPLGLHLPAGVKLDIDSAPVDTLPLQTCDGAGCYAALVVSPALVESLKRGTTLNVTFQDSTQRNIPVPVSLNGFTAAYENIQ